MVVTYTLGVEKEDDMTIDLKVIRYYRKDVWGQTLCYPVDYMIEIQTLTGQKTLKASFFKAFEGMGFKFEEVLESSIKTGGC